MSADEVGVYAPRHDMCTRCGAMWSWWTWRDAQVAAWDHIIDEHRGDHGGIVLWDVEGMERAFGLREWAVA